MTEGRVWICTWKRTKDGYRVWVKKRPKIYAEAKTFAEADEALAEEILHAGDPENQREYDPPRPDFSVGDDLELVELSGGINARLLNVDGLTSEGQCPVCECPRGARNAAPVRVDRFSGGDDGGAARTRHLLAYGFTPHIYFYSERLLDLLTPGERGTLELRPIARAGRSSKRFYEILAARTVLSLAVLKGDEKSNRWRCESCGWKTRTTFYRDRKPYQFVARGSLPAPMPSVFAFADANGWLQLGMTRARWRELIEQPGTTGITSSDVGVVDDAEVATGELPYLSLAERVAEERLKHREEVARWDRERQEREAAAVAKKAAEDARWPGVLAAANAGDPAAQLEAGRRLVDDTKTVAEGYALVASSAAQGHVDAILCLADLTAQGVGVERDQRRAVAMIEELATREPGKAHAHLAVLYKFGIGLKADRKKAEAHAELAKRHGERAF